MNSDNEESIERILFEKVKQMEREFTHPGVQLSIKRKTDGTINYVRRCMTVHGELEYNSRWGVPFSSPPAALALSSTDTAPIQANAPPIQEPLALMSANDDDIDSSNHGSAAPAEDCVAEECVDEEQKEDKESEDDQLKDDKEEEEYVPSSNEESEELNYESTEESVETQTQLLTQDTQEDASPSDSPPSKKILLLLLLLLLSSSIVLIVTCVTTFPVYRKLKVSFSS